ncbi:hypothetical protein RCL1_001607 [Eukaryota sp. TZLM3-RCL]
MIIELHNTCRAVGVVSSLEPLLNQLVNRNSTWKSKSRGDLHLEWLNSKQLIVDATTFFFKSQSDLKRLKSIAHDILENTESLKQRKYQSTIDHLNTNRQVKLEFIPIAVSLCGRLSTVSEQFFADFQSIVRSRGKKYCSIPLHKIKFVLALFKRFSLFLRKISLKLSFVGDRSRKESLERIQLSFSWLSKHLINVTCEL